MKKILIIDDESGIRHVLTQILTKNGYEVITADDGKVGLDIIEKDTLDLVFLDIQLPDMDGLTVLEEIRKKKSKIPVIMCSGFGETDFAVRAVKLGAADYIGKPFKNEEVINVAKKALSLSASAVPSAAAARAAFDKEKAIVEKKKKTYFVAGLIVLLLAFGSYLYYSGYFESSDRVYEIPYSHPSGMCRQGEFLWVTDWFSQAVYKHKLDETLSLVKTYNFPDLHPGGITVINNVVWTCDSWAGVINKHKMDDNLSVEKAYPSPQSNPTGLFWDGRALWSCDGVARKIYKHRLDGILTVEASYDAPEESPVSLMKVGKNIWSGDRTVGVVYMHNTDSALTATKFGQTEDMKLNKGRLSCFATDKSHIWYAFDEIANIYKVEKSPFKNKAQKKTK